MRANLVITAATVVLAAALTAPTLAGARRATAATPAVAAKAKRKTVRLYDNYFQPRTLTVRRGASVRFSFATSFDIHNVTLVKAPRGVRKFASPDATGDYVYSNATLRRLKRAGTYRFVCTLHEGMKFTLRVR